MLRIFEGVTGFFFRIKVQNDFTDNRTQDDERKTAPENNNKLFVPDAWC